MHQAVLLAASVTAMTGVSAFFVPRRLRPDVGARMMTGLILLSLGGAIWALFLIIAGNVVQLHGVAERFAWCTDIVTHHRGSFTPLGLAALGAAIAISASVVRVRVRQLRHPSPSDQRALAIVTSDDPIAYALPGHPGQIVVSTGMLRSLDPQQRRVLIAHERAHLRRGHHRYVRITEVAVAAIPLLSPLTGRVRFALERWADEDAALEIGDRATVASAIARAALSLSSTPAPGLAIADACVVQRVQIMLQDPAPESPLIQMLLGSVMLTGLFGLIASLILIAPRAVELLGFCH